MSEVRDQISAVSRSLGLTEAEGRSARLLVAGQTYDAAIDDVWDAVTSAERIPRWFLPVSGDLRLGGRYQLEGNAGGAVLECEPPRHLLVTWEYGPEVSWLQVRLTAQGERTALELRHTAHVDDERWREFGPGAVGIGWDMMLNGLGLHLRSGAGIAPEEAAAWMASDEARLFMTLSGERWCTASIAAGTAEDEARAAAERCLAFYTGSPTP